MKKIDEFRVKNEKTVFVLTRKNLKNFTPFDFGETATIFIGNEKTNKILYMIYLKKEKYNSYWIKSLVVDAKSFKVLTTSERKKGFLPCYIDAFLSKSKEK
jgi:hypothetical protein